MFKCGLKVFHQNNTTQNLLGSDMLANDTTIERIY